MSNSPSEANPISTHPATGDGHNVGMNISSTERGLLPPANPTDNEVLVRVEGVSKKFCRSLKKSLWYGVQDLCGEMNPLNRNKTGGHDELRPDEFWAVNNVSFELRRGECLGLIGRNGAGKTTLLKMLNGLIKPDRGRIEMRGRIGALIALGAGFNPILSGRENIYVNGSVLGLSKAEIDEKIDDIIDFSDIRDFIDAPVQSYSSGMQVRLGFAVATAMDPDVLILDEVLAVGDAAFRDKCYRRIISMRKKAAVIFVSHSMDQVARICDLALVMTRGNVIYSGGVAGGVNAYERINDQGEDVDDSFLSLNGPFKAFDVDFGDEPVKSGGPCDMNVSFETDAPFDKFILRAHFYNPSGAMIAECNYLSEDYGITLPQGKSQWRLHLDSLPLRNGKYRVGFNIIDPYGDLLVWSYKQKSVEVQGGYSGSSIDCHIPLASWETASPTR